MEEGAARLLVMSNREIKVGKSPKDEDQLKHLRKLEKENRRLRMENDLLKKVQEIDLGINNRSSKRSKS